jgi:glycosyltransferase involved in cell wall biosynthesis
LPADKIDVVGGGYDGTLFTRAPKTPAGTVQLLYAGKLNRSKGVPWLLRSLMKIRHLDWHLHLAGSGNGPEFDECVRLARRLDRKVTLHGYVSHRRLSRLMQRAHVQVLPSFFEGLPLVLFEGLASGCRVITTQLPGFDEIFGGARSDSIDLLPLPPLETIDRPFAADEANLEKRLCDSLVKMIAQVRTSPDMHDPHAERIAADYTWESVFERVLSVYRGVGRRSGAAPA